MGLHVLATLYERPMHPIQWGSLHTVVANLTKHGFVEAGAATREGRRLERTVYRLTGAGRDEIIDWPRGARRRLLRSWPGTGPASPPCGPSGVRGHPRRPWWVIPADVGVSRRVAANVSVMRRTPAQYGGAMREPLPPDPFDPACPSSVTPFQIGDKWTGTVLTCLRDGMITRTAYGEIPPRVEHAIGRTLFPAMDACRAWAERHLPVLESARAAYALRTP
ncbi:hypothetical protein [Dactylosporangium sp. CA-233914]|uniref:hypothetical protein n=1 Tax=Dactylosporangium sp. CA-233914 TaxID=3239934 RepID=UPI003D8CB019